MWNWLLGLIFGPEMDQRPGYILMRSRRLDVDAVREVFKIIERAPGGGVPQLKIQSRTDIMETPADIATIETLSDSDLLRLFVRVDHGEGQLVVDFRENLHASVSSSPNLESTAVEVVKFLLDEGSPRVRWQIVKVLPAAITFLSVIALGAALLLLEPFEQVSQNVLAIGTLLLVAGLMAEANQRRRNEHLMRTERHGRGHRVVAITRERIRTDRANRHQNLKVGFPTALVSAAVGTALGAWLTR